MIRPRLVALGKAVPFAALGMTGRSCLRKKKERLVLDVDPHALPFIILIASDKTSGSSVPTRSRLPS